MEEVPGSSGTNNIKTKSWKSIKNSLMASQYESISVSKSHKYRPPYIGAKLVTLRSLQLFAKFTRIVSYLGATPYVWNEKSGKFELETRSHKRFIYVASKSLLALSTIYLICRFIALCTDPHETFMNRTVHFLWTSGFLLAAVLNVSLIRERDDVRELVNQLVFCIHLFEEIDPLIVPKKLTKLDVLMLSFVVMGTLQIPLLGAVHILNPTASPYPASWLLENHYSIALHVASFLYELLQYTLLWSVIIFYVCYHYTYSKNTAAWAKNIRSQINKHKENPSRGLLSYYRILQLLNNNYNDCTSLTLMVGHKIVVLVMTVMSTYATVHLYHAKLVLYLCNLVIMVGCMLFQVIAYPTWSALFKISNGIRTIFLPRDPAVLYHRKFLKSCGPLKIWVGHFYFFRPFTPMKFFRIEFTYTMKVHYYLRK